ncbi:MAG: Crp/Fnr family transcriptional regulator [Acidimicrobiia bacterium]|nr:Crp/Fnr family transcriptional regulator [Acidimicrobiia bacterium]
MPGVDSSIVADKQHLAWLARYFGRPDYLPLTPSDISILDQSGEVVTKFPRSHLFREGEQATRAFLIEKGEVSLYRGSGDDRRVVARVGPGAVIGDIAMFSGDPYISSAQANTHVTAFQFERERLLPELAQHPAVCLRWLVAGLRQLEHTQRRVIHLLHKTVRSRVADLLAEEADADMEVRLSQATIATLLGTSRQSVNEAISELRDLGIVKTAYRRITVMDCDGLQAIAISDMS